MTAVSSAKADVLRLRFDHFELDEADARLTRTGQPMPLPPRPFAVLCTLARSPHMLVTKDALLDTVWGHRFVSDSVLKTAVSEVRAALGDDPKEPRYIETVSRRGYRFIANTVVLPLPQPVPTFGRDGPGALVHPGLAALTALCRGDAAIGNLVRAVAAALEQEPFVLNDSQHMPQRQARPSAIDGLPSFRGLGLPIHLHAGFDRGVAHIPAGRNHDRTLDLPMTAFFE